MFTPLYHKAILEEEIRGLSYAKSWNKLRL